MSEEDKPMPIHNNVNCRGILRKINRPKSKQFSFQHNENRLMLDFMNTQEIPINNTKCFGYERNSILTIIRARKLKQRNLEERQKEVYSAREYGHMGLRLEPVSQIQEERQQKNMSQFNIHFSKKTSPVKLFFNRSKTARTSHISQRQRKEKKEEKDDEVKLPVKRGLVGFQISSHSPMNRKISLLSN